MRALFDTNVLIAAFVAEGLCAKLLLRARRREFVLCACPFILDEFREKLRSKLKANQREIKEAVRLIEEAAVSVKPTKECIPPAGTCRDRDDENVLACAVAAKADYIVTGDSDLLDVGEWAGIGMISPRTCELQF